MTTLAQVSKHLGLSMATVSRAINGYPEVNAKTKARVLAAAEELGYRSNSAAQRLANGKSKWLVLCCNLPMNCSVCQHSYKSSLPLANNLVNQATTCSSTHPSTVTASRTSITLYPTRSLGNPLVDCSKRGWPCDCRCPHGAASTRKREVR